MSDCRRRSGATSSVVQTAMPRTIVVLFSMYTIMVPVPNAAGVVGESPLPSRTLRNLATFTGVWLHQGAESSGLFAKLTNRPGVTHPNNK